ncbi:hypothetical protein [Vibrio jasicida]|uniref:hypothetical protein n=1 Tax=Vibrio jasicida TaxID=766224 RepID=UPI00148CAD9E|nr:hypothetical protein [Vibrio jasicida]NOJ18261.1 hypothetical protein [Vibrio jasicida]
MTQLTEDMKQNIKTAIGIEGLSFKYAGVFDIYGESSEPVGHRILCRGQVTKGKWVWLGKEPSGPFEFETEKQARLFVREIRKEAKTRTEV